MKVQWRPLGVKHRVGKAGAKSGKGERQQSWLLGVSGCQGSRQWGLMWTKLRPQCTQSTCLGAGAVSPIKGGVKEAPSVQLCQASGSLWWVSWHIWLIGQLTKIQKEFSVILTNLAEYSGTKCNQIQSNSSGLWLVPMGPWEIRSIKKEILSFKDVRSMSICGKCGKYQLDAMHLSSENSKTPFWPKSLPGE